MAAYWGLKAIAKRLDYAEPGSVGQQIRKNGLPAYKRRRGHQTMWWIDDELIYRWQLEMARKARQIIIDNDSYKDPQKYRQSSVKRAAQKNHQSPDDTPDERSPNAA